LYLAPILLLDLGVEFAISKLRFSKTAIDEMCQIERSKAAQFYEEKATKAMRSKNEDNELPALIT
jgi:hypothetical protein